MTNTMREVRLVFWRWMMPVNVLAIFFLNSPRLIAQWSSDPSVNVRLAAGTFLEVRLLKMVSDGAGGAIVTWADLRSGPSYVYAQHIDASGVVLWGVNGLRVCTNTGQQFYPAIATDGAGGAIICWSDLRGQFLKVYAQRLNGAGALLWSGSGVFIGNGNANEALPAIVEDGSGGAIVAWQDFRDDTTASGDANLYGQRVNSSGTRLWNQNDVALCTAALQQTNPVIVSNGSGGAIIVWEDYRNGTQSSDVYAQDMNSSGSPLWTVNGAILCRAVNNQLNIKALADGVGGAYAVWTDLRGGTGTGDIYGQHVNSSGAVQWSGDGTVICGIPTDQLLPEIVSDGAGGSVVSWMDSRAGSYNIYAQRLNGSGVAQWQVNGVAVTPSPSSTQSSQKMINDGAGNTILTWADSRPGQVYDIYAQKLNGSGNPQWLTTGTIICNAPGNQDSPVIVTDATAGAIVAWPDSRDSISSGIYSQNVDRNGNIGTFRILSGVVGPGSIVPNGVVLVNGGANQTFTLTPNSGSHIDSVIVDGANLGAAGSHTFPNVTSLHSITGYFSSNPSVSITVLHPNGGELLQIGTIDTIRWTSSNVSGTVSIFVSTDGGTNFGYLVPSVLNAGSYPWFINQTATNQALIAVISDVDTTIHDVSDGVFTIRAPGSVGGVLRGTVTDASNGFPLQNATVTVAGLSVLTNSSGGYVITGIPPGALRAEFYADTVAGPPPLGVQFHDQSTEGTHSVMATATGFLQYRNDRVVIGPGDTVNLSFSMSQSLAVGSLRFVLNWGADPSDLDSYLETPLIGGQQYRIYYGYRGRASDVPFDSLDNDVTTGFGPETITMYRFYSGTYHYYINKYSGSGELTQSGGSVQIYSDAGLIQTIRVPTAGRGEYWRVCDIDGSTKAISIINQIDSLPPGNLMSFSIATQKKISNQIISPHRNRLPINSWFWTFGDGATSILQNPRHVYQQNGLYTVSLRVANDTSQSVETKTDFIAVGSVIHVNFSGNGLSSNSQNVVVSPPTGFQPVDAKLFYRLGGAVRYDSVSLDTSTIPYRGTIPASSVTIRGLEYYVTVTGTILGTSTQTTITSPSSNPMGNPYIQQVRFGVTQSATTLSPEEYRMVSVPANLNDPGVRRVLVDDFGEYDNRHWRFFRWRNNAYKEYPDIDSTFVPGKASWLITNQGGRFDVDSGLSVVSGSLYTVMLDTGWNQIANPFAFPVAWTDVQRGSLVKGPFYYDGSPYILDTLAILLPWEGYFVRNDEGIPSALIFPPLAAGQTVARSVVSAASSYTLQMIAEVPGTHLRDAQNYLGLVSGASVNEDAFDYPDPPGIDPAVHLSIMQGTVSYLRNFKPFAGDGESWDVQIRSDVPASQVTVSLSDEGQMPDGFHLYVLDRNDFNIIELQNNQFTVRLDGPQSVRSLKIILGTPAYAAGNSEGIPLVPVDYALEQNYPNPFNPTTTIRYQLSKRSEVRLEVFNLLGQRVKTLFEGEQVTGAYSVTWRGDSNVGTAVASGVYIYRIRAGEFVQSKKLLLLR